MPVSYTHLDVYKRQLKLYILSSSSSSIYSSLGLPLPLLPSIFPSIRVVNQFKWRSRWSTIVFLLSAMVSNSFLLSSILFSISLLISPFAHSISKVHLQHHSSKTSSYLSSETCVLMELFMNFFLVFRDTFLDVTKDILLKKCSSFVCTILLFTSLVHFPSDRHLRK